MRNSALLALGLIAYIAVGAVPIQAFVGLQVEQSILIFRENNLYFWNPITNSVTSYLSLVDDQSQRILTVRKDANAEVAYAVRSTPDTAEKTTQAILTTEVLRIDLKSKSIKRAFQRNGITSILLSPDGQQMIVTSDNNHVCLLNLNTDQCRESSISVDSDTVYWIDAQTFVAKLTTDLNFYLVHTDSFQTEMLPKIKDRYLYTVTPIRNSRKLVIGAGYNDSNSLQPVSIFLYDIANAQVTPLITLSPDNLNAQLGPLFVSPDEKYLIFLDDSVTPVSYKLVRIADGKTVASIVMDVALVDWFPDSSAALLSTANDRGTLATFKVTVQTGEVTKLTDSYLGAIVH